MKSGFTEAELAAAAYHKQFNSKSRSRNRNESCEGDRYIHETRERDFSDDRNDRKRNTDRESNDRYDRKRNTDRDLSDDRYDRKRNADRDSSDDRYDRKRNTNHDSSDDRYDRKRNTDRDDRNDRKRNTGRDSSDDRYGRNRLYEEYRGNNDYSYVENERVGRDNNEELRRKLRQSRGRSLSSSPSRNRSKSRSPARYRRERSISPDKIDGWRHDRFDVDELPPKPIEIPRDYRPPSPTWVSRAGGVAIMRKK